MIQDLLGSKIKTSYSLSLYMTKYSQIKIWLLQKGQIHGRPVRSFLKTLLRFKAMPYRAYQTDKRLSKDVKGMLHRTSPLSNGPLRK